MAEIAKYQRDLQKFQTSYLKAAITEPTNFWLLAGFLVAAAFTASVWPLLLALIAEAIYIVVLPNIPQYREMINNREREKLFKKNRDDRERLIATFTSVSYTHLTLPTNREV